MTFTQLDDALMDSPGFLTVSRSARLLVMEGYTYCNRQLTDGYLTRAQWLRSTDTEDIDAEIGELLAADVIAADGKGYRLDWSKQQTREQVLKARERKRTDNERRAKSLELHKAGDHSLCTHAGGGHGNPAKTSGPSSGRSTGRSGGRKQVTDGPVDGPQDGPVETPTPLPTQPTHSQPIGDRRVGMGGGDGALDGLDSAGAPSTLDASPAAESPRRSRRPREESTEERLARADAIVAELNWEPETDDPEGLAGLVDAAPAVSSRGHG